MEFERDPDHPHRVKVRRTPEEWADRLAKDRAIREGHRPGLGLDERVVVGEITAEQAEEIRRKKAEGPRPWPAKELVAALRAEREHRGLSLADVAGRMGVDRGAVHKIEIGLNRNPTIDTLTRYAAALGVVLEWKLAGTGAG